MFQPKSSKNTCTKKEFIENCMCEKKPFYGSISQTYILDPDDRHFEEKIGWTKYQYCFITKDDPSD